MNLWLVTCMECTAVFHNSKICLKKQKCTFPLRFYFEHLLVYFTKTIKENKIKSEAPVTLTSATQRILLYMTDFMHELHPCERPPFFSSD